MGQVVSGDFLSGGGADGPGLLPAVLGERGVALLHALGAWVAGRGRDRRDWEPVERGQVLGGGFDGEAAVRKLLAQCVEGRWVGDDVVVDDVNENGHGLDGG